MECAIGHLYAHLTQHEFFEFAEEPLPANPLHIVRCIDVDGYVGQMLV